MTLGPMAGLLQFTVGWAGFLFLMSLMGGWAAAERNVIELHVAEDLPVYAKPRATAKVISQLSRGDVIVISPIIYDGFRKVLVTYRGRSMGGYVPVSSLRTSKIRVRAEDQLRGQAPYRIKSALGVALVPSFMHQDESQFQLRDGTVYETTAFSSSTVFPAIFYDIPMRKTWDFRAYLALRTTQFEGRVQQKGSPSPAPIKPKAVRDQALTGLGLVAKHYGPSDRRWWWGGGFEFAMGNKVTIKFDNVSVPTENNEMPFFAMFFAAVGTDFSLPFTEHFFLVPDLRAGLVLTTKPVTFYAESLVGVAYRF